MNRVCLIGNLVKTPDLRYTQNNTPVASYTIAINNKYGEKQETDYINITTWGKRAEFVTKYFSKGQSIAITGRLKNKNYEDKNGIKHYSYEVVTEDIEFAGAKKEQTDHEILQEALEFQPNFDLNDDELPF